MATQEREISDKLRQALNRDAMRAAARSRGAATEDEAREQAKQLAKTSSPIFIEDEEEAAAVNRETMGESSGHEDREGEHDPLLDSPSPPDVFETLAEMGPEQREPEPVTVPKPPVFRAEDEICQVVLRFYPNGIKAQISNFQKVTPRHLNRGFAESLRQWNRDRRDFLRKANKHVLNVEV